MNPWTYLGLEPDADERAVKRAYARLLKDARPEDDAAGFQALRDAYDRALTLARARAEDAADVEAAEQTFTAQAAAPARAPVPARAHEHAQAQALPAPMDEAQRIWSEFLAGPLAHPRQRLAKFVARDEMLDLAVRECFELCALRYCAGDVCSDEVREALAAHFDWEAEPAFVQRHLPNETWEMLARLRAWRSWQHFLSLASGNKAIRALLADTPGRDWGVLAGGHFTVEMQKLIAAILAHHREMLHFKLNRTVFDTWVKRVEGRRYFITTAAGSLLFGAFLAPVLTFVLTVLGYDNAGFGAFIASEILTVGAIAWFKLKRPAERAESDPASLKHRLLYDLRYRPSWQFGWIPVYALASSALFVPDPPAWLAAIVGVLLAGCLAAASFANSPVLNAATYVVSAAAGVALAAAMSVGHKVLPFGLVLQSLAMITAVLLFFRTGNDLCGWARLSPARVTALRLAWMAGTVALVALGTRELPFAPYAAFMWAWLIAGLLLIRASVRMFFGIFGGVVLQILVVDGLRAPLLKTVPIPVLLILLFSTAIFMTVNLVRTKQNQHPFS